MTDQEHHRPVSPGAKATESGAATSASGRALAHVVSAVVGRVGYDALDQVVASKGRLFDVFPLVWVIGTAAAGKSTVTRHLQSVYPEVPVIHDRHALVEAIGEGADSHGLKSLPTVVDREVLCSAFCRIARTAEVSPAAVIELGRGQSITSRGQSAATDDPMSLSYALRALAPSVLSRSLFLYLSAPLSERLARNSQRPLAEDSAGDIIPNVRCSEDTMLTVFHEIDAQALVDRDDLHFVELRNVVAKADFIECLELFFGAKK